MAVMDHSPIVCLAARGKSTIGRAHRACEASSRREEESNAAQCKHCGDIVDDEG
jgi:hypothetical protein